MANDSDAYVDVAAAELAEQEGVPVKGRSRADILSGLEEMLCPEEVFHAAGAASDEIIKAVSVPSKRTDSPG